MVERIFGVDDSPFAITNDGRLYASELQTIRRRLLMTGPLWAQAITRY